MYVWLAQLICVQIMFVLKHCAANDEAEQVAVIYKSYLVVVTIIETMPPH